MVKIYIYNENGKSIYTKVTTANITNVVWFHLSVTDYYLYMNIFRCLIWTLLGICVFLSQVN